MLASLPVTVVWCRLKRMLQAAAAGIAIAQMEVGTCYQMGRGVKEDIKQAVTWFKLAAKDRVHSHKHAHGQSGINTPMANLASRLNSK